MAKVIPLNQLPLLERGKAAFPASDFWAAGAVIPMDKPTGWSSFDVVKYVRNRISVRKVGHAGTLDPLATGLLVLCSGRATRSISQIQNQMKTYLAEITLGTTTPSFDAATEPVRTAPWDHVTREELERVIQEQFIGEIEQVPPAYSALQKNGERFYRLVRRGVKVEPEARLVDVYDIALINMELPKLRLTVRCGKGFYVRSLANDLGEAVGTLGYLSALRRTGIGPFCVDKAWSVEEFNKWSGDGRDDSVI